MIKIPNKAIVDLANQYDSNDNDVLSYFRLTLGKPLEKVFPA